MNGLLPVDLLLRDLSAGCAYCDLCTRDKGCCLQLSCCVQGPLVNGSLPVDLLLEEVSAGAALTPNTVKYVSITGVMKERGLALPKRPTG